MKVSCLPGGLLIFTPEVFRDNRGYFVETFSKRLFEKYGIREDFVQDNQSCSNKNVARGFHFQNPPYAQAKLVRVIKGAVWDFAMDLRKGSENYGKIFSVFLSEDNFKQFYIPRGFAHAFIALEDDTLFAYKCDNYYNKESEGCIRFEMKHLSEDTKINYNDLIFSEKDKMGVDFLMFETNFV